MIKKELQKKSKILDFSRMKTVVSQPQQSQDPMNKYKIIIKELRERLNKLRGKA